MAGRIRSIKPELLDDEVAAGLSDAAWRLFVSSWILADDHGCFRAGARYLAPQGWPDTRRACWYWRTGAAEMHRSVSKAAFVRALQRLVPGVRAEELVRSAAGLRAPAIVRQITDNIRDHTGQTAQFDDMTLIILKRLGGKAGAH